MPTIEEINRIAHELWDHMQRKKMKRYRLALTDHPLMDEAADGDWIRFNDHDKIINQSVPKAWEKKLQQFERLRQFAYPALTHAHQVLSELDQFPELVEMQDKVAAKNTLITWQLSQEQYNALVRDAMNWRAAMNPANDHKGKPE